METLLAACGEEATEDATDTVVNSSAVAAANSFGGAVTPLEGLLTPRRAVGGLAGLLLRAEGGANRLTRAVDQPLWVDPETGYTRRQVFLRHVELIETLGREIRAKVRD